MLGAKGKRKNKSTQNEGVYQGSGNGEYINNKINSDVDDYDLPVTQAIEDDISNIGVCSHIGTRANQQDSSIIGIGSNISPEFNGKFIAAVCDGMGGLEGGEIASSICAKTFYEDFFSNSAIKNYPEFFKDEIDKIDFAVSELKNNDGEPMRAGSTFVAVVIDNGLLYWACVGDSHLYIVRGNEIVQVNRDHNYFMLLKEKVKLGEMTEEEASSNKQKEALVSYMGMKGIRFMDVNEKPFVLQKDDSVVLCSDGLYRLVSDDEMLNILSIYPKNMNEAAKAMVETANDKFAPHQDNTSVIIFKYM